MRGFTLVELMVVLAIIGLMSAAVMLTAPGDGDVLGDEAGQFAMRLVRAQEEAILTTRAVEVTVTAQGYAFARQSFGDWQPLRDGPFDNMLWPNGIEPVPASGQEQIVFRFDPTGVAAVETLALSNGQQSVRVVVDAAGEVEIDASAR